MILYCAVAAAELADVIVTGRLRSGIGTFEGKWFAESATHAAEWGRRFYNRQAFHILTIAVEESRATSYLREPHLDTVGPARYVEAHALQWITVFEVLNVN